MDKGFAEVNGTKLYYEIAGSGIPVVFIHGFPVDCTMWDDQFGYFSENYKCIRYDARGFGKSAVPKRGNLYSHHEDLYSLLQYLNITEPVILTGLSMGGSIAANFAVTYPDHIKSIIFADSAIGGFNLKFDISGIYELCRKEGIKAAHEKFINHELFAAARKNKILIEKLKSILNGYSGWHWVNSNPVRPFNPPAIELLGKITAPALIIVGENDLKDFHDVANILNKKIKNSRLEIICDAGHICNMEKPDEFNKIAGDFLNNLT